MFKGLSHCNDQPLLHIKLLGSQVRPLLASRYTKMTYSVLSQPATGSPSSLSYLKGDAYGCFFNTALVFRLDTRLELKAEKLVTSPQSIDTIPTNTHGMNVGINDCCY